MIETGPGPDDQRLSFDVFVADTAGDLLRLATVVTGDPATAQDVVQSVLERAFGRWPRIAALDNPGGYVRRMVTNEAISVRRRARRLVLTPSPDEPPGRDDDELRRVGEIEEAVAALRRLPPRQRAALALRYLCDLPDAEIARHLGCREATVRGYVLRGLRTLRFDAGSDPRAGQPALPAHPCLETS